MRYAQLQLQTVERGSVIDWEFLGEQDLAEGFVHSFRTDAFTGPQWERLFRMSEPVYDELVRELFATYRFDAVAAQGDMGRTMIRFRLGGVMRSCSVMEFGWRVGLSSTKPLRLSL